MWNFFFSLVWMEVLFVTKSMNLQTDRSKAEKQGFHQRHKFAARQRKRGGERSNFRGKVNNRQLKKPKKMSKPYKNARTMSSRIKHGKLGWLAFTAHISRDKQVQPCKASMVWLTLVSSNPVLSRLLCGLIGFIFCWQGAPLLTQLLVFLRTP